MNSGKEATLESSKSIDIDLREGDDNFYEFYLEMGKNGEYLLNLKGVNGEGLTNNNVLVSYSSYGT
jgi:hypothetical protein